MSSEVDAVDAVLVRHPFDALKRAAKERKSVVDEAAEGLERLQGAVVGAGKEQQRARLDELLAGLQDAKRRLQDVGLAEGQEASRCRQRLSHLQALGPPPKDGVIEWAKGRQDRVLVDHLLRSGHYDTAAQLAGEAGAEGLTDLHIFQGARRVVEALRRRSCAEALAWCAEHRPRLRKLRSKLEFRLRVQEMVEMVRGEARLEAVLHARRHLAPWAALHMAELQRAVAAVAFSSGTPCPAYAALFHERRWQQLVELFYQDLYRLHGLPPGAPLAPGRRAAQGAIPLRPLGPTPVCNPLACAPAHNSTRPIRALTTNPADPQPTHTPHTSPTPPLIPADSSLEVHLQAGLAALNTPLSYQDGCGREDPLHLPAFQKLAQGLPSAKHVKSKLICSATRETMDEANPPLVLPNGWAAAPPLPPGSCQPWRAGTYLGSLSQLSKPHVMLRRLSERSWRVMLRRPHV
jgi:macrophage erythroblast attacher